VKSAPRGMNALRVDCTPGTVRYGLRAVPWRQRLNVPRRLQRLGSNTSQNSYRWDGGSRRLSQSGTATDPSNGESEDWQLDRLVGCPVAWSLRWANSHRWLGMPQHSGGEEDGNSNRSLASSCLGISLRATAILGMELLTPSTQSGALRRTDVPRARFWEMEDGNGSDSTALPLLGSSLRELLSLPWGFSPPRSTKKRPRMRSSLRWLGEGGWQLDWLVDCPVAWESALADSYPRPGTSHPARTNQ